MLFQASLIKLSKHPGNSQTRLACGAKDVSKVFRCFVELPSSISRPSRNSATTWLKSAKCHPLTREVGGLWVLLCITNLMHSHDSVSACCPLRLLNPVCLSAACSFGPLYRKRLPVGCQARECPCNSEPLVSSSLQPLFLGQDTHEAVLLQPLCSCKARFAIPLFLEPETETKLPSISGSFYTRSVPVVTS